MATEAEVAPNPLNLPDEDFINTPEPEDVVEDTAEVTDNTQETAETSDEAPETSVEEDTSSETPQDTETTEEIEETVDDTDESEKTTADSKSTESSKKTASDVDETVVDKEEDDKKTDSKEEAAINYEAEYKKLLTPFKANGKQMQISNVDDAVTLMKMGANYNKKMAALKPNLRLMKMLENNELLDEEKLSYLIDLDKKNPEAVQKFIKESGIDPLDIDTEKDTDYTPSTYTVNDKEVELDGVLDEIRDTPSFQKTIDIVGTKWDASSKKVLIETPAIIRVINEQVENGIFDQITNVIESERMLGRLQGLSDLEAYKQVGDAIQAKGGFSVKNPSTANEETTATTTHKSQDDPKLKQKKRAASTTRTGPGGTKKEDDYNPLALSDAEFEKVAGNDFI